MLIQNLFRTLKPFHKRVKKDILCTNKALEWGKKNLSIYLAYTLTQNCKMYLTYMILKVKV